VGQGELERSEAKTMTRTIGLLFLLAAGAAFIPAAARAQTAPSDFFPKAAGDHWSYVVTSAATATATEEVRVVPVGSNAAGGLENYFGNGALSVVHETSLGTVIEGLPGRPMLWYVTTAPVGTRWTFRSASAPGAWNNTRVTLLSRSESVDVPAGHFDNCVKLGYLRLSGTGPGPVEEVFAPGIGLVRRVEAAFATRTWELASGSVGGRPLPILPVEVSIALDRNHFVFAGPVRPGPGPTLKVRLKVASDATTESFDFPTTQRYEIRIRDESGAEVWLWSRDTGQVFSPVPGSETAGPGRPLVYEQTIPLYNQGGLGRTPARLSVEAILWDDQAAQGVEQRVGRSVYTVLNLP
jgi:hypothetical protein